MLESYDIDPKLLADEINKMMPLVMQDLHSVEDKIAYGEKELLRYLTKNERVKALAFMDCFEGNTGETLDIQRLISKKGFTNLSDTENEPTAFTNHDLPYIKNSTTMTLSEVVDNLSGFIKIYFE